MALSIRPLSYLLLLASIIVIGRLALFAHPQRIVVKQASTNLIVEEQNGERSEISVPEAVRELKAKMEALRGPVQHLIQELKPPQKPTEPFEKHPLHRLKYHKLQPRNGTIFVLMSSFREPHCQRTVEDLFNKAKFPKRVNLGLVEYQGDAAPCVNPKYNLCNQSNFCPTDNIRFRTWKAPEQSGYGWATSIAASMYRTEQYIVFASSRTVFVQNWDALAIDQLEKARVLSTGKTKPILTLSPPLAVNEAVGTHHTTFLCEVTFKNKPGIVQLGHRVLPFSDGQPVIQPFMTTDFAVADSSLLSMVPPDPHLSFLTTGSDFLYSARAFTSGFIFFAPGVPLVALAESKVELHPNSSLLVESSQERTAVILQVLKPKEARREALEKIADYFLGKLYTWEQFKALTGVDVVARTLSKRWCNF